MKPVHIILILVAIAALVVGYMLFRKNQAKKANQLVVMADDAALAAYAFKKRQFENECEAFFNTQAEVDACVSQKLATA